MTLTAAAIRLLADKGLTPYDIADLIEAMAPAPRNANAERQAAFRERRKAAKEAARADDSNVTHNVTPPNDNISNPPKNSPSEAKASLAPKGRNARLPDDWEPKPLTDLTAEMVSAWPAGLIERELSKFKDYWKNATGRRAAKSDWQAAWRYWLTNTDERMAKDGRNTGKRSAAAYQPGNRDGFVNACLDAAMGGNDACDPFGPGTSGTGHGGAQPVLRLASGRA